MRTDPRYVPDVRRIGVLRANALGDFIVGLPALDALRAAYPSAEIVLLGRVWHAAFLAGRPSPIDRVVALPPGIPPDDAALLPPTEVRAILDGLAAEGWDLALQLHGGGRHSNPVVAALHARVSAGCRTPDAAPLDRTIRYVYHQSEVARMLELVGLVGARPVGLEPRIAVTQADRDAAGRAAAELDAPYAVLHPGSSDPRRRWPPTSFATVGDALARAGLAVVVTGTAPEAQVTGLVVEAMECRALDLTGALDLAALTGLLAGAALVVANDTGPLHLAGAVGAATVGIYWVGNVINGGTPFRSRHRPAISWRVACPACGVDCTRATCSHDASFVADVPVGAVLDEAFDLLPA